MGRSPEAIQAEMEFFKEEGFIFTAQYIEKYNGEGMLWIPWMVESMEEAEERYKDAILNNYKFNIKRDNNKML